MLPACIDARLDETEHGIVVIRTARSHALRRVKARRANIGRPWLR